ncbi:hypothetical protein D3C71_2138040 [compost metagenome]
MASKLLQAHALDRCAIDHNLAFPGIIEAQQQLEQSGFAASARTDYRHLPSLRQFQTDLV